MAKRKLQAMNQKEEAEADPPSDTSEDESEEDDGEEEQDGLGDTNTAPAAPIPLANHPALQSNLM